MADKALHFYFDYSSPFAYLGNSQAPRVAKDAGVELRYEPIFLGGLFKILGAPMVPLLDFSESKRRHANLDMARWAAHWGVPFRFPSRFPMRTVDALRLTLGALKHEPSKAPALIDALFKAYWAEDRDLADRAVREDALRAASLPVDMIDAEQDSDLKQQLINGTQRAADLGVFGVPTFMVPSSVGPRLFWGQDRLELVSKALGGWLPEVER